MGRSTTLALLMVGALAMPTVAADDLAAAAEEPGSTKVEELGGAWRRTPAGPFGAVDLPGGWTGTELVVTDPDKKRRAASYLPSLDRWDGIAQPPRRIIGGSDAHWTGTELLFVEPRGTARRGPLSYDPVADSWRTGNVSPINEVASSAWAGDVLVVASKARGRAATYDPETDTWTELPALPEAVSPDHPMALHWTGDDLLALVSMAEDGRLAVVSLDLEDGEWGEPAVGPLMADSAPEPLWIDDALVFHADTGGAESDEPDTDEDRPAAAEADVEALPADARYEPGGASWTELENACGLDTTDAVWTGSHVLSLATHTAWEPGTGGCFTLSKSPWKERTGALRVWTGDEVLEIGGSTGGAQPRRDGVAYDPSPQDGTLGVRLDKSSRPVRVRIPSLGIDLPIVWDGRKISGGSAGYPACDVAEYWSAFGEPGEPGTSWILAHAQQGMFLPLLSTLNSRGKEALLGREVEVQLRDGRLLTYRTYKVNPRATNTRIATKNLKPGEHRLVLQTSTGVGSAPKLLVAARLVDATTTDEPRPKPDPRACG